MGWLPAAGGRRSWRSCNCVRAAAATSPTSIPQLESLAADLADHHVILDGEAVALDESGVPNFGLMQNRAHVHPRRVLGVRHPSPRRPIAVARQVLRPAPLLEALAEGGGLIVPDQLPGDGPEALEYARKQRWEGVVAKKRDSTYQPGRRSPSWIKDKLWHTQEVVIGGWRAGEGGRTSGIGALLLGVPADDGLQFAGESARASPTRNLTKLKKMLEPLADRRITLQYKTFRSRCQGRDVRQTELVGEVRYSERTSDGRLRQPSWRGFAGQGAVGSPLGVAAVCAS